MALRTLICGQVNALQYRCRNCGPAVRTMSATSKGGRVMTVDLPWLALELDSESGVGRVDGSSCVDGAALDLGKWASLSIARYPFTAGRFEDPFRPPTTPSRTNA